MPDIQNVLFLQMFLFLLLYFTGSLKIVEYMFEVVYWNKKKISRKLKFK